MLSRKSSHRLLSLILSLTLLLVSGTCLAVFPADAASYQSQIDDLEKKQQELKKKIDALQGDIDEQEALRDALQEQIDTVQDQIDLYNDQIEDKQDEIDALEAQKATITQDLETKKATFLDRIRAMYIAGNDSALTIFLGADDFADYLYQNELLATVTEYDNEVMAEMRDQLVKIDELEKKVLEEQSAIEALRSVVDVKRAELGDSMKTLNSIIGDLQDKQDQLQFDFDEYQEKIDELEEKIKEATNTGKNDNIIYSGDQFLWPTPGFYYISSNYGQRWGRLHKGVDIAGSNIYGTPIIAAADGVVSLVDYNGGGYGYYVMVNHGNNEGNNYVTLYAHMSKQSAYVGQTVSAGDIIGYVGSTGRSTGPHLHFEIRVNGTAKNPLNFF